MNEKNVTFRRSGPAPCPDLIYFIHLLVMELLCVYRLRKVRGTLIHFLVKSEIHTLPVICKKRAKREDKKNSDIHVLANLDLTIKIRGFEMLLDDEEYAIEILKYFDIKAIKIEESNTKSPDFLIELNGKKILIELKSKYDDSELIETREDMLNDNKIHQQIDILKHSNTISGITNKAYKQLKTKKNQIKADECYIFFLTEEPDSDDKIEKIHSTLFGKKLLVPLGTNAKDSKFCFYYSESDFFRYKDVLDGAIISNGSELRFCLNNYSINYKNVKNGVIVNKIKSGINDPIELEKAGNIYLADCNIDRKDIESLDNYLKEKYSIERFIITDFPSITYRKKINLKVK
jgi:hypothetical protein